jgi:hypothetical protein
VSRPWQALRKKRKESFYELLPREINAMAFGGLMATSVVGTKLTRSR